MAYQALYRQWRPLDFNQIKGQKHITEPIRNQIKTNSFGHAYIFSGTRGTGKTSTAKVFARAVNCLNSQDGNPCNVCENCKSILDDQFIDVIEMDAASNNSVDDIRELREHVKFAPSKGKYKVYIIDEVHMLSTGAFNALLKTLEEPPEYVLFILATTESHKIPQTIVSRCQKFDFKRVSYDSIFERIKYICDESGIHYEDEAIKLIIQKSDGAVRDSLSHLDQCLSVSQDTLRVVDVIELLGLVEKNQILDLIHFMAEGKREESFLLLDDIIKNGKDINQFINAIIEVYRDLLIVKMVKENHHMLINASNEYIEVLQEISKQFTETQVTRGLNAFIECSKSVKYSQNKRIIFETTLVKLMAPEAEVSVDALIERIEKLEKALAKGLVVQSQSPAMVHNDTRERVTQAPKVPTSVSSSDETSGVGNLPSNESVKPDQDRPQEPIESFVEFTAQDVSLDDIIDQWGKFIDIIKQEKKGIYPTLEGAKPSSFNGQKLVIQLDAKNKLFVSLLTSANNQTYLNQLMSQLIKRNISLEFDVDEQPKQEGNNESMVKAFFQGFDDKLEIK